MVAPRAHFALCNSSGSERSIKLAGEFREREEEKEARESGKRLLDNNSHFSTLSFENVHEL